MRRYLPLLTTPLLCALTLPAAAFTGSDDHPEGAEPTRVVQYHAQQQQQLLQDDGWQDFLAGEGQGWTIRFDELTGAPLRMYGRGIDVGTVADSSAAEAAVRAFLGRHADLLMVSPKSFDSAKAAYSDVTDTWYVDIPVSYGGVSVWRGAVTARIKAGKLVMVGIEAYDGVPRVGTVEVPESEAIQIAIDLGLAPDATHTDVRVRSVWLPLERAGELLLVRAHEVRSNTTEPPGRFVTFVDAETGELLGAYNEIRFFNVSGRHNTRVVDDAMLTSPLRDLYVFNRSGSRAVTDAAGNADLSGSPFTMSLQGPDLVVVDQDDRRTYEREFTGDLVLASGTGVSQPEISTWVFIQDIQEWGKRVASDVDVRGNRSALVSNVNVSSGTCNAYYDGNSVNFYVAGRGCNNTGLIADVNYHEWGHGFHANSLLAGTFDGSISEGAADTVSFLQTDDHIMAPTFMTDGGGIREVATDRVYPRDVVNEVHTDGLIFAGAMWDLIEELEPTYGREGAREVAGEILAGLLKGGPTLATVGEEALVADDDDGDLSNGSPHFCEVVDAFSRHGLLPQTGSSAAIEHDQVVEDPPADGIQVTAKVADLGLDCVDINEIDVVWRAGGESGSWERATGTVSGGEVLIDLPDLPYGTFVEYYLETGSADDAAQVPPGGVSNPLSLYVGGVLDVYCNDFEADDGGFTHELLAGEDREGADDWQWGAPGGKGGDPYYANSGVNVWGNDLGNDPEGRWNGEYQNDRHNRLTSPELTFPEHLEGVFLRYARWLQVEDGVYDNGNILADGDVVWSNYDSGTQEGGFHHQEDRWVIHSVDLGDASADGSVQIAWEIISDQGLSMGGWTLDDVCLYAPATANNRLAILDFQAGDNEDGGVTLTWTNPKYAPLAEVVVVRKEGSIPTGPDDGDVVFVDDAPELEAPMTAFDDTGDNNTEYYYAAFGGDGTEYLGWAVEGRNVDLGSGFGQPSRGLVAGGCSCDSSGSQGTGLAFLGLGALLLGLRRRRKA